MSVAPELHEERDSLWALAVAPSLWAGHLLLSYCTAAVWCAKAAGPTASLATPRAAIAVYTLAALVGIAWVGWRGWRRHRLGRSERPHDFDSQGDRYRFLGFSTFILSGLSAVAVVFATLPPVFMGSCV